MREQVQIKPRREEQAPDRLPHAEHKSGEELKAEMDAVLDDIDAVLEEAGLSTEEAAQAQVANFVQKGGE